MKVYERVTMLGAHVITFAYDGLMAHPNGVSREALKAHARIAASEACGCDMPIAIKDMKLPKIMRLITKKDNQIAGLTKLLTDNKISIPAELQ